MQRKWSVKIVGKEYGVKDGDVMHLVLSRGDSQAPPVRPVVNTCLCKNNFTTRHTGKKTEGTVKKLYKERPI